MTSLSIKILLSSRSLTKRQKYCVLVSALSALGLRKKAYEWIAEGIGKQHISLRMSSELFIHLSLFLGYPIMLEGLERLQSIKGHQKHSTTTKSRISLQDGRNVFRRIYGGHAEKVLSSLDHLHGEMVQWVLKDAYGRIFTRRGMSLDERELVNLVVLGIQGFAPQFFSHVRGALRVGVSNNGIADVLKFIAPALKIDDGTSQRMFKQIKKKQVD